MAEDSISKFPEKKYSIIYADCPWSYDNGDVTRGGVNKHYLTMDIEEIKALPVAQISDDPSVLLLWATFPKLPEAIEVIKAWGFIYKTNAFTWIKKNDNGTPFFGVGYYTKSNAEICLLATRGNAHSMVKSNAVSSVIFSPLKSHSKKPALVRSRIVELFGDIPRIELFARDRIRGWDSWGDQIPSDIQETICPAIHLSAYAFPPPNQNP